MAAKFQNGCLNWICDNTEVKVPISKNDNSNLTNDMMYSPLSGVNGDDKYLAKYNHVVYHFRDLPTDMFVAHIVQE